MKCSSTVLLLLTYKYMYIICKDPIKRIDTNWRFDGGGVGGRGNLFLSKFGALMCMVCPYVVVLAGSVDTA